MTSQSAIPANQSISSIEWAFVRNHNTGDEHVRLCLRILTVVIAPLWAPSMLLCARICLLGFGAVSRILSYNLLTNFRPQPNWKAFPLSVTQQSIYRISQVFVQVIILSVSLYLSVPLFPPPPTANLFTVSLSLSVYHELFARFQRLAGCSLTLVVFGHGSPPSTHSPTWTPLTPSQIAPYHDMGWWRERVRDSDRHSRETPPQSEWLR